jgi:hypothetical protein
MPHPCQILGQHRHACGHRRTLPPATPAYSPPCSRHRLLIDLWSCLSTVADRQLWARAAYPCHHASVPAPGDPRGDDLRCSVACGRSRNTRDWACREGSSGGRRGCGHRRFGSGAKDRNSTALIHLLARIGRSVHGLTFTALLALLLAAHGVSRWDPEPHPLRRRPMGRAWGQARRPRAPACPTWAAAVNA